jgi:hypothetical protein
MTFTTAVIVWREAAQVDLAFPPSSIGGLPFGKSELRSSQQQLPLVLLRSYRAIFQRLDSAVTPLVPTEVSVCGDTKCLPAGHGESTV